MADTQGKPRPVVDDLSRPFWEAARRHELVVQRCEECGYYNHPPRTVCGDCQSQQLRFEPVSGRGTIHSFSVMYQPAVAGFERDIPYLSVLVELEEQSRLFMVTDLPATQRPAIRIGRRVTVSFQDIDEELTLPRFRPTKD